MIEKCIGNKQFIAGDGITYADFMAYGVLKTLRMYDEDMFSDLPILVQYMEMFAVQKGVEEAEKAQENLDQFLPICGWQADQMVKPTEMSHLSDVKSIDPPIVSDSKPIEPRDVSDVTYFFVRYVFRLLATNIANVYDTWSAPGKIKSLVHRFYIKVTENSLRRVREAINTAKMVQNWVVRFIFYNSIRNCLIESYESRVAQKNQSATKVISFFKRVLHRSRWLKIRAGRRKWADKVINSNFSNFVVRKR